MESLTKINKTEFMDHLLDAMPIMNLTQNVKTTFEKEFRLSTWHHYYKLYLFEKELEKLTELLGTPIFKGCEITELETEFYETTAIWGYKHENTDGYVFVYLSKKGLSVEITDECESDIDNILDTLIETIIDSETIKDDLHYNLYMNDKLMLEFAGKQTCPKTCKEVYDFIKSKSNIIIQWTYTFSAIEFAKYLAEKHKAIIDKQNEASFEPDDSLYYEYNIHLINPDMTQEEIVEAFNTASILLGEKIDKTTKFIVKIV